MANPCRTLCTLILWYTFISVNSETVDEFTRRFEELKSQEVSLQTGRDIKLSSLEERVNKILEKARDDDDKKAKETGIFAPALPFHKVKEMIHESKVYKFIKMLPKGGNLHIHDVSMTSLDWLVKNATYREFCYMCIKDTDTEFVIVHFRFSRTQPEDTDECSWKLVSEARRAAEDIETFDKRIENLLDVTTRSKNPNTADKWDAFEKALFLAADLVFFERVFGDYFYRALEEHLEDNVQYVEVRSLLGLRMVYDLNGNVYDEKQVLQIYDKTAKRFKEHNPDFIGTKFIYCMHRINPKEKVGDGVKLSVELLREYPDIFAGFDLVGFEEQGHPYYYYAEELLYPSQLNPPVELPYFFHAGETSLFGTATDENLISAVLLNTKRIGHGYALSKHPVIRKIVKERGIAVEVNPISNQQLGMIHDLQNHPASVFFAEGLPLVVSSDDPSAWEAGSLSDDFYEFFVGIAGKDANLATLKKLAQNSIMYSALDETKKAAALRMWEEKWDSFLQAVIKRYDVKDEL